MYSFLTGSHAYGTPREDSDVDLVVLVKGLADFNALKDLADEITEENPASEDPGGFPSLRFGRLNLICLSSFDIYHAWYLGTQFLIEERPVTKERAIEVLHAMRDRVCESPAKRPPFPVHPTKVTTRPKATKPSRLRPA